MTTRSPEDEAGRRQPGSEESVAMEIQGLMLDPSSKTPIVILRDRSETLLLPIWIGSSEANAIALRLEGMTLPRPMTHDLLQASLEALGGRVERIEIVDLEENTFYARIVVCRQAERFELDSRPSDALALAVRTQAPIFVARRVLEKADAFALAMSELSDEEKIRRQLEELEPEDLGKYKM